MNKFRNLIGEDKTLEKPQSDMSYKLMSFMFKIRDFFKPRGVVLKRAGIKPGAHVLDFGCGPGSYIVPLAKIVGQSGKIYALDMNPAAILTVKSLAANHKLKNVQTILSEKETGLPDNCIDAVLLYDIFHYLKEPGSVLAELHRVLKSDGVLSVSDHHMKAKKIISGISSSGLFRLSGQNIVFNFSKVE